MSLFYSGDKAGAGPGGCASSNGMEAGSDLIAERAGRVCFIA